MEKSLNEYVCYKKVHAAKIETIEQLNNGAVLTPSDKRLSPFKVDSEFMDKHNPKTGGYFVLYQDGYQSYSPAKAFEGGYKLA